MFGLELGIMALLIVIIILILYFHPYRRIRGYENMCVNADNQVSWLLEEVNSQNARVEQCYGGLQSVLESDHSTDLVTFGPNETQVTRLKVDLADKINYLMGCKEEIQHIYSVVCDLKSKLTPFTYRTDPDLAAAIEDKIGALNARIASIGLSIDRTRAKIKSVEDQILSVDGEVPFNHYNNYMNLCYSGPWY